MQDDARKKIYHVTYSAKQCILTVSRFPHNIQTLICIGVVRMVTAAHDHVYPNGFYVNATYVQCTIPVWAYRQFSK